MAGHTPAGVEDGGYIPVVAANLLSESDDARSYQEARGKTSGQGAIVNWLFWKPSFNWQTASHDLMQEMILQAQAGFDALMTGNQNISPKAAVDVAADWAWMRDDDTSEFFSFRNCCDALGIEYTKVRQHWIEKYSPGLPALRRAVMKRTEESPVDVDAVVHELRTTVDTHAVIGARLRISGHYVSRIAKFYLEAHERAARRQRVYHGEGR